MKRHLVSALVLAFSFISFSGLIRTFAYEVLGWSFPIAQSFDQFLPLIVAVGFGLWWWSRDGFKLPKGSVLLEHLPVVIAIVAVGFWVQGQLLDHFFFKEDVVNLVTLQRAQTGERAHDINQFFSWAIYYPFTVFFGMFSLVGVAARGFNVVSFLGTLATGMLSYVTAFMLLRNRLAGALVALLFIASPIYLEVFIWQLTATGFPLAVAVLLAATIAFLWWRRRPSRQVLVLALLLSLATLKLGFVRTAIFPAIVLVLDLALERSWSIKAAVLSLRRIWHHLAIFAIAAIFASTTYVASYSNQTGYSHLERFWKSSLLMVTQSVPFSWVERLFKFLPDPLPFQKSVVAVVIVAVIVAILLVGVRYVAPRWFAIALLGFTWYAAALIFTGFFGDNVGRHDLDFTLLKFPYVPGSKYLHLAAPGWYLGLVASVYGITSKLSRWQPVVLLLVFAPLIMAMGIETRKYHRLFNQYHSIPARALFTEIFPKFLLKTDAPLLLYSKETSPIDGLLNGGGDLVAYGLPATEYFHDFEQLRDTFNKGKYQPDQVYSFKFDRQTLAFEDTSVSTRQLLNENR